MTLNKKTLLLSSMLISSFSLAGDIYSITLSQNNENIIERRLFIDEDTPFSSNRTYAFNCKNNQTLDKTNTLYLKVEESDSKIKYFFYTNSITFKQNDCSDNNTTHILQSGESAQLPLKLDIYDSKQSGKPYTLTIDKK